MTFKWTTIVCRLLASIRLCFLHVSLLISYFNFIIKNISWIINALKNKRRRKFVWPFLDLQSFKQHAFKVYLNLPFPGQDQLTKPRPGPLIVLQGRLNVWDSGLDANAWIACIYNLIYSTAPEELSHFLAVIVLIYRMPRYFNPKWHVHE